MGTIVRLALPGPTAVTVCNNRSVYQAPGRKVESLTSGVFRASGAQIVFLIMSRTEQITELFDRHSPSVRSNELTATGHCGLIWNFAAY
jgi:hypothetical protein